MTAEEKFFQARLPPTENTEFTKVDYFLTITPVHGTIFKGKQMKVDFPIKINHDHTEKSHQVVDPKNWNPTDLTKAPVKQPTEESEEEEYEEPLPVKRQPDEDYDTEDEIEQLPDHLREKIRYMIDSNVEKRVKDYMEQMRAEIYDELEDHRIVTQEQIDTNIYGAPNQSAGYYPPTGYPKRGAASRSPVRKPKHSFIK